MESSYRPSLIVLLAVVLFIPGLVSVGLRSRLPSDPSSPVVDFRRIVYGGLVVQPLSPDPQGLQKGDIVMAIQGQPVDQTISALLSPQKPVETVSRIEYTVLRDGRTLQLDAPFSVLPLTRMLMQNWSISFYLIYLQLVSILVFILRPRLPAAQLFFVVSSILFSSALVYFPGLRVDDLIYRWQLFLFLWGGVVLYGIMLAGLVHLSLIFPEPHPFLLRHPRSVLWLYVGVWLPLALYLAARWAAIVSPAGRLALTLQGTALMSLVYFPLLLISTYTCYRFRNPHEQRQMRWLMWALMISLIPYLVFTVIPSLLGLNFQLANSLLGILWCTVPTSFAIAVLHERLFDIDVIIRRTLIYSALTITLGVVYFISILLLQRFLQDITGQGQPPLAIVLSTLVIAALFTPLRRRIQNDIDRRFYRRKYDAEKLLKAFGLTVRNEVKLEMLSDRLLDMVEETMEPQSFSLWIRKM
jgi:hypothetical protein